LTFAILGLAPLASTAKAVGGPCGIVPAGCGGPGSSNSGCTPLIGWTGTPSATAPSGCTITATGMDGQRLGGFFYGLSYAPINIGAGAGGTSWFCGPAPRQRMNPFGNTNGVIGGCDGARSIDVNTWMTNNTDGLGAPFVSGLTLYIQGWNRDSGNPSSGLNITDGLAVTLCP
jgi:hypothetical protein